MLIVSPHVWEAAGLKGGEARDALLHATTAMKHQKIEIIKKSYDSKARNEYRYLKTQYSEVAFNFLP